MAGGEAPVQCFAMLLWQSAVDIDVDVVSVNAFADGEGSPKRVSWLAAPMVLS